MIWRYRQRERERGRRREEEREREKVCVERISKKVVFDFLLFAFIKISILIMISPIVFFYWNRVSAPIKVPINDKQKEFSTPHNALSPFSPLPLSIIMNYFTNARRLRPVYFVSGRTALKSDKKGNKYMCASKWSSIHMHLCPYGWMREESEEFKEICKLLQA